MAIYTDTKIAQGPFLFISGQTPSQDGATPEDPHNHRFEKDRTASISQSVDLVISGQNDRLFNRCCLLSCCPYGVYNYFGRKQTSHESRHRCRLGCP